MFILASDGSVRQNWEKQVNTNILIIMALTVYSNKKCAKEWTLRIHCTLHGWITLLFHVTQWLWRTVASLQKVAIGHSVSKSHSVPVSVTDPISSFKKDDESSQMCNHYVPKWPYQFCWTLLASFSDRNGNWMVKSVTQSVGQSVGLPLW